MTADSGVPAIEPMAGWPYSGALGAAAPAYRLSPAVGVAVTCGVVGAGVAEGLYGAAAMLPRFDEGAGDDCAAGVLVVGAGVALLAIRFATSGVKGGASVLG
jgi:hypothetical protein